MERSILPRGWYVGNHNRLVLLEKGDCMRLQYLFTLVLVGALVLTTTVCELPRRKRERM
jgi:hypothetical protein